MLMKKIAEEEQKKTQRFFANQKDRFAMSLCYPELGPIKNERATSTIGWSSETELPDEDWARVRTALEEAIKQK
jgi:hypothetical protein